MKAQHSKTESTQQKVEMKNSKFIQYHDDALLAINITNENAEPASSQCGPGCFSVDERTACKDKQLTSEHELVNDSKFSDAGNCTSVGDPTDVPHAKVAKM